MVPLHIHSEGTMVLALALVLAGALAGCGGNDEMVPVPAPGPAPGPGGDNVAPWENAQPGDIVECKLKDLLPTQLCLGKSQIYYHLGRKQPIFNRFTEGTKDWEDYMKDSERKRGDDYCEAVGRNRMDRSTWVPKTLDMSDGSTFKCEAPPAEKGSPHADDVKTAVVGPGGKVYITDGHHSYNTLFELADGGPELPAFVRIVQNWKDVDVAEFWSRMSKNLYVWLRDADDQPIDAADLPQSLGMSNFQNDHFRTFVRLTKDMAYSTNSKTPVFVEFKWGSWLRRRGFDMSKYNFSDLSKADISIDENGTVSPMEGDSTTSYVALVRDAAMMMVAAADDEVIDDGQTASALGKLPWPTRAKDWNDLMKDDIWRGDLKDSGSPRKGGRAWYAMKYEQCGGAASTQPECWHGDGALAEMFVV